jgi:hypothetical protein
MPFLKKTCHRLVNDDTECGQPARYAIECVDPMLGSQLHPHYYCSKACAAVDAVALYDIGHEVVSGPTYVG